MKLIKIAGITPLTSIDSPIYLGSNFTWSEATKGGSRLPIDTKFRGTIIPAAQITSNMIQLARKLDEIRAIFGDKPISITSWYRPPNVNRAVGGAIDSEHQIGWGADFRILGISPQLVAQKLAPIWAGGLGDSRSFTHIDLRHLMGRAATRWNYGNT